MIQPDFDFELSLLPPATRFLLGVDEVGRGPLAGPLVVAGFLLDLSTFDPAEFQKISVRDSKLLSSAQRQKIITHIEHKSYSYHLVFTESGDIDRQGISASLRSSFLRILDFFSGQYDFCLIDGAVSPFSRGDAEGRRVLTVIKGDANCFSIAAASIVAKVARDALMDRYDVQYPQYGFAQHKGYGTPKHLAALKQFGPCPLHRRSFKPIRSI